MKHKADVNLCKNNGSSPLSIAYENGHTNIVEFLQKNGANISCEISRNGQDNTVHLNGNNFSEVDLIRDIGK